MQSRFASLLRGSPEAVRYPRWAELTCALPCNAVFRHANGAVTPANAGVHSFLRHLFLWRFRYHVYDYIKPGKVIVLTFWHASRGSGPTLSSE
jgi:hypothetical protein